MLNARSIANKSAILHSVIAEDDIDIILVTETFLDSTVCVNEILPSGFNVLRKDRSRHGGGVLIAIKENLPFEFHDVPDTICEVLWCEFKPVIGKPVLFSIFYRPPSSDIQYMNEMKNLLQNVRQKYPNRSLILCGDFNVPGIDWINNIVLTNSKLENEVLSIVQDNLLTQCVHEVTRFNDRSANCLDLVFTSDPGLIGEARYQ